MNEKKKYYEATEARLRCFYSMEKKQEVDCTICVHMINT